MDALGYQQITSLAAATGLTIPAGTAMAFVQPEAQNVRWRDDAVDPTSTVGMILIPGVTLEYTAAQLPLLKFIEVVAGAKLNISYYGTQPL